MSAYFNYAPLFVVDFFTTPPLGYLYGIKMIRQSVNQVKMNSGLLINIVSVIVCHACFLQYSNACRLLDEELFIVSFRDFSVADNVFCCSLLTGSESWPQGWVPCNTAGDHPVLHLPWQILRETHPTGSWRRGHRWGCSHQGHNYSRRGRPEADKGGLPEEEQCAAGACCC